MEKPKLFNKKKSRKNRCQYEIEDEQICGRDLYDEEHCIFHSKSKDKEGFDGAFWEEFNKQKEGDEPFDFRGFVFPGKIIFENTEFKKEVDFWKSTFYGPANFDYTTFMGSVYFENVDFEGKVDFRRSVFSKAANFRYTEFKSEVDFFHSFFYGKTDFFKAEFKKCYFNHSKFTMVTYFNEAVFYGVSHFDKTHFMALVDFRNIKIIDYQNFTMISAHVHDSDGLIEILQTGQVKCKILKLKKTNYLPDNFRVILGEGAIEKHPVQSRKIRDDMYVEKFRKEHRASIFYLWWIFADCGRSLTRWILWSILFILLFASIFQFIYFKDFTLFENCHIDSNFRCASFVYYSVSTFTTLGDITPKVGLLQIIVLIEVVIGYIMLGGLIGIISSKIFRKD